MIYLLLFTIEVVLLFVLERSLWKSFITPVNVLMLPYSLATLVAIIYPIVDGHTPHFYFPSLIIWMIGLVIFEIPSILIAFAGSKLKNNRDFAIRESKHDDFYWLLVGIAFFCIAVSMMKIGTLMDSIEMFGTDEFSDEYQVTGLFAHLGIVLNAIASYAIYKLDRKHLLSLVVIAGALVGMYAVGTKSWIIASLLVGYYARLLSRKTSMSWRTILLPILIIVLIFFLSYYFIIVIATGKGEINDTFISFIANHFAMYICSGSLTLSLDFGKGFVEPDMTDFLFAPIINIFNVLFGGPHIQHINPINIDIGNLGESNVRTFFGTIYAFNKSSILFLLLPLMFSFISNTLYFLSRHSRSIFLLLANCAFLVYLTFGFHEYYWLNLSCYEIPVYFLLMHVFLYRKRTIRRNKTNNVILASIK